MHTYRRKVLASLPFLLAISFLAFAPSAEAVVGFIDVQKVFTDYKESAKAREELQKKEESYKKEFDSRQEKLDKAEKDEKSKEDLEKMRTKLQEELAPQLEELQKLRARLSGDLQEKIVSAVKEVSKNVGVDTVIDKQAVIAGGVDLTDLVVTKLNKGK